MHVPCADVCAHAEVRQPEVFNLPVSKHVLDDPKTCKVHGCERAIRSFQADTLLLVPVEGSPGEHGHDGVG